MNNSTAVVSFSGIALQSNHRPHNWSNQEMEISMATLLTCSVCVMLSLLTIGILDFLAERSLPKIKTHRFYRPGMLALLLTLIGCSASFEVARLSLGVIALAGIAFIPPSALRSGKR
jgi:hypothetical protein